MIMDDTMSFNELYEMFDKLQLMGVTINQSHGLQCSLSSLQ